MRTAIGIDPEYLPPMVQHGPATEAMRPSSTPRMDMAPVNEVVRGDAGSSACMIVLEDVLPVASSWGFQTCPTIARDCDFVPTRAAKCYMQERQRHRTAVRQVQSNRPVAAVQCPTVCASCVSILVAMQASLHADRIIEA
jgi:hypothetical protein